MRSSHIRILSLRKFIPVYQTQSDRFLSLFISLAMAGNIIPAIATTNAIISGVIVMQALNILNGKLAKCKTVSCILVIMSINKQLLIRSDERLTLETSALLSLDGGNLTFRNLFDTKFWSFTSTATFLSKLTIHLFYATNGLVGLPLK